MILKKLINLFSCDYLKGVVFNYEDFFLSSRIKPLRIMGGVIAKKNKQKRSRTINNANKNGSDTLVVSIILPAYNSEKTIGKTIKGIQGQSYQNWELLVIDDGSTDDTSRIINELVKRDSRIKAYQNITNQGAAYARNVGLFFAKGDYVTFHDADDTSHPERLEYQLAGILSNPKIEIVISQYVRVDSEGETFILNGRKKRNYVSGMMFRKSLIKKIGYFKPLKISEDSEYHERILATYGKKSRKIICKTLYYALFSPDSLLFSNSNVSINNKSVDYKIHAKELLILDSFRLEHKRIVTGELSPYQDFILDEGITMRLNSHE